mmetsp:Transcript_54725/g.125078  ORF Transcript_54725/g.125078 Transcript_54725/m.125078 type:complete len:209 (+) Transcript_54725:2797-3423(+)
MPLVQVLHRHGHFIDAGGRVPLVVLVRLLDRLHVARLRDLAPRVADVERGPVIDRLRVVDREVPEHETVERLSVEALGGRVLVDLLAEPVHLGDELGAEGRPVRVVQVLQLRLVLHRALEGDAIAVGEEGEEHPPDPVLHLHPLREPRHGGERALEVRLGRERRAALVFEDQREVAYHPQEVREKLRELRAGFGLGPLGVGLGADVLG